MDDLQNQSSSARLGLAAYTFFFALFAALLFAAHAPFLRLPCFWDEAGQFIPAALDFFHFGALVPHSVIPNVHPPGVMVYLAGVWTITGYSILSTRFAMLALAAISTFLVFLLGLKLREGQSFTPALFAAFALCCSPIFYSQAVLAQLDMPAMLFAILATLLFLEDRIFLCAIACTFLVLVKETGLIVPLLFALWLLREKRLSQAFYFILPAAALGSWLLLLRHDTGHLFGSAEFAQYNLVYLLHPVRIAVALSKRMYFLFIEDARWIGTIGIVYAWRRSNLFRSRSWRIIWSLVAINVLLFSVAGGAMLERYLLPVTPLVYIAMLYGWSTAPVRWRALAPVAMIAMLTFCNFWNPPYPFPLENNLAFTDFVRLQQTAALYIEEHYPNQEISTAWPFSAALMRPEFGYVTAPHRVRPLFDFSESSFAANEGGQGDVFVLYSHEWDPTVNLMHNSFVQKFWRRFFLYEPQISSAELDRRLHTKVVAAWTRRGQWIEIHARD